MRALTPDDLLPLEEYAGRRREFFEAQCRYLDRYRRVRVGPRATLLFENRQTLWFRVQEVLRLARWPIQSASIRNSISTTVCCRANHLHAALLIEVTDETRLAEELAPWQVLRGEDVRLVFGHVSCPAELVSLSAEDRCIGAAHWLQFNLDGAARVLLSDVRQRVHVEIHMTGYRHASPPLGEDVRQSLGRGSAALRPRRLIRFAARRGYVVLSVIWRLSQGNSRKIRQAKNARAPARTGQKT